MMNNYITVAHSDKAEVDAIYKILRQCGIKMAKKGLFHWIPFYSKRRIRKDCDAKTVVLVWDNRLHDYTSTFQMNVNQEGNLHIGKVATSPKFEGNGIGKENLEYIESFGKQQNCSKICLDVYSKSSHAINFYLHNGFAIVGNKRSVRFKELIMEKAID